MKTSLILVVFCYCVSGLSAQEAVKKIVFFDSFKITAPANCNSDSLLEVFATVHGNGTSANSSLIPILPERNKLIIDTNLLHNAKDSGVLIPFRDYLVTVWAIQRSSLLSFAEVVAFLRSKQAIFVGARALVIAFDSLKQRNITSGQMIASITLLPRLGIVFGLNGSIYLSSDAVADRDGFGDNFYLLSLSEYKAPKNTKHR